MARNSAGAGSGQGRRILSRKGTYTIFSYALIIALAATGIIFLRWGVNDLRGDQPLKVDSAAPAPFLRFYTDNGGELSSLTATVEVGTGNSSQGIKNYWIDVAFGPYKSSKPFSWRIALLCVPADTSTIRGSAFPDADVKLVGQVATPPEACQTPSARSEVVVTGTYPPKAPASAPMADIGQDTSGVVRFGIPAAEQDLIVHDGDDYRVSIPHVLSSSDLCPSSTPEPQPTGSTLTDIDGGPQPTSPECTGAISSGIRSFRVVKVLDEPLDVLSADTTQAPAMKDQIFYPRPGFRWNDESGSAVVAVQLTSPEQDAIFHKDEIYGAIWLAIAAAAFIALFQEVKDRLKPEDKRSLNRPMRPTHWTAPSRRSRDCRGGWVGL